jgi:hypothetical protein
MFRKIIFACSLIGAITFQSCKTEDGDPEPTLVAGPAVILPSAIKNVDGVLAAIVTVTKNSGVALEVGSAYAAFYKNKNSKMKLEAGTVKINAKGTTMSSDTSYFYTSSASEPKGLEYLAQVYWQVSGNTANDVPVINNNDGSGLPNVPSVPEFININKDQDYLLNWISSFGGDSAVVILKGPSATFKRTVANSISSITITKADIAKLGAGSGNLQVINYKLEVKTVGTKSYAFVKQSIGICSKVGITQ